MRRTITLRDLKTHFNQIAQQCDSRNTRLSLSKVVRILAGGGTPVKYLCDTTVESDDGKHYKGVNAKCSKGELIEDMKKKHEQLKFYMKMKQY